MQEAALNLGLSALAIGGAYWLFRYLANSTAPFKGAGNVPGSAGRLAESRVSHVRSEAELREELRAPGGVVVDFTATWCGPCQRIAPEFERLAGAFPALRFLKLDVDGVPGAAQEHGVRSMPTFLFFKGGRRVAELKGADAAALKREVMRLAR